MVPAAHQGPALPGCLLAQRQFEVALDRVVDGGYEGHAPVLEGKHPRRQGLVVMDHIIGVPGPKEVGLQPTPKGVGFGKPAREHAEVLKKVRRRAEVGWAQRRHVIGRGVQVEARNFDEPDALIKLGIGRAGKHFDPMAKVAQGPREGR